MKIYTKEYGYLRAPSFWAWIESKIWCNDGTHMWRDLGDPCYCGSDNCARCEDCGIEVHD